MQVDITKIEDTQKLAQNIAKLCAAGDVILLSGDLGAGKTTFASYLIDALCGSHQEVTSPTFNLVQLYDAADFTIWHFDLYRLEKFEEVYELGIEDAFDGGVSIIEWPEIAEKILPLDKLLIKLNFSKNSVRCAKFVTSGAWQQKIKKLKDF